MSQSRSMKERGMDGINAYTRANPHGGVTVDVEGMLVDLITIWKAGGETEAKLHNELIRLWKEVEVNVSMPKRKQN